MSKLSVNELTDELGTGAPAFPNGMSVTGAALTDPEITGGIFLGGTGSANKLDDYEEGTWTPTYETTNNDFSGIMDVSSAFYTKVGRLVVCNARFFSGSSGGSGNLLISGLPFAESGVETTVSIGQAFRFDPNPPVSGLLVNATKIRLLSVAYTSSDSLTDTPASALSGGGGKNIMSISVSYETSD